jgi:hypothetical protein
MVNGVFILFGLIMIFIILITMKLGSRPTPSNCKTDDVKISINYDSYMNHLEWMFQMGLISVQEYNKYHQEGLMFIRE